MKTIWWANRFRNGGSKVHYLAGVSDLETLTLCGRYAPTAWYIDKFRDNSKVTCLRCIDIANKKYGVFNEDNREAV